MTRLTPALRAVLQRMASAGPLRFHELPARIAVIDALLVLGYVGRVMGSDQIVRWTVTAKGEKALKENEDAN